jgi:hypothetical protein
MDFKKFSQLIKDSYLIHYHFSQLFADLLHLGLRPLAPAILTYKSDIVRQSVLREELIYSQQCFQKRNCCFRVMSTPTASETAHATKFLRAGICGEEESHPT